MLEGPLQGRDSKGKIISSGWFFPVRSRDVEIRTSTPSESASSLAALPFTRGLLVVVEASVATESMEVSPPSRFDPGPGSPSPLAGVGMAVSPAVVDEVDFRGMVVIPNTG